jgi:tetratricopeptide (TPR) repeat protein
MILAQDPDPAAGLRPFRRVLHSPDAICRGGTLTRGGSPATFAGNSTMKSPAKPESSPRQVRRWPVALAVVAIGLGILSAYHNAFSGPFIYDDETAISDNPSIRHLWPPWTTFSPPPDLTVSGRPLANFTLAVNYALSGTDTWSYHALNLLIHVLAGLTLFGIVRRTLAGPVEAQTRCARLQGHSKPTPLQLDATLFAFTVALLWSLHPLQAEAVTYIVQRVESLMALFFLLTFYCFIRSVDSPKPRFWQGCAVGACLLGAATKEVIAMAPVLVLLYDRTFVGGSFAEAWRRRRWLHLALAATWLPLAALVAGTGWNRNGTSGFDIGVSPWAYWLTQFEALARYLRLSVWPHPLVFEYGTFWVHRTAEVAAYALLVVPLAVATLVALWRWPVPGFLGAWFFGILAPTSIMPGRIQMIVEHRMYLPLAAVIAAVAGGLAARGGRRGLAALLVLAAALGCLTERRNEVYRAALTLWSDTVASRPDNDRAQNNLANALDDVGRIPEAITHYETALRLKPDYPEAHSNLGNALRKMGRIPEAIAQCQAALQLEPDYAKAHSNLANALLDAGRIPEAIAHYETALRLKPDDPKTHYNFGNAWLKAGHIPEAIAQYEAALRLKPADAEARYNLGNALFFANRVREAIAQYEAALRLKPDYLEAHTNLGSAYLQADRTPEAIAQFTAALQIKPGYAEGCNNLGAALSHAGRIQEAITQFEAALRLKPDYPDARQNLARMQALLSAQAEHR